MMQQSRGGDRLPNCRSAYNNISRVSLLAKLLEVAMQLLPFARFFVDKHLPSSATCMWDAAGNLRETRCGKDCEQGDALTPRFLR